MAPPGHIRLLRKHIKDLTPRQWQLLAVCTYYAAYEDGFEKYGVTLKRGEAAETYETYGRAMGLEGSASSIRGKVRDLIKQLLSKHALTKLTRLSHETHTDRVIIRLLNINELYSGENGDSHGTHTGLTQDSHHKKNKELRINNTSTLFDDKTVSESTHDQPAENVSKETQKREKSKKTNPDVKAFIDYAFETFKAQYGRNLLINGGKDGASIERLLKTYRLDEIKAYWGQYLVDDDEFVASRGRSIALFSAPAVIMRYVSGAATPAKQGMRTCPMCSGDRKLMRGGREFTCPKCQGKGEVQS